VTQLDYAFGRLMKALDEQKLADNTFVAFTSDNGPEGDGLKGRTRGSTGGLRGRKRAVYEGGIRVPGIIRWPGRVTADSESATPVVGSDLFPTVLEIAGAPLPTDRPLDGTTLVPLLAGQAIERKVPLYFRCSIAPGQLKIALRDGDWKILANEKLTDFELYNLAADPHETTDLATKEPERFAKIKETLVKLNAEIEAEGPDWWRSFKPPMPKAKAKAQ
jgi:arylsulfatase A